MKEQMSLFDGLLNEMCDTKPEIGRNLIFLYKGQEYHCKVEAHCGYDFFWVKFLSTPTPEDSEGWHISVRGYKEDWRYAE